MTRQEAVRIVDFVAELVRGAKALKGIGLREISKDSGISIATLSRIDRGGVPDAITFIRLTEWLRQEIDRHDSR